MKPNTRIRLAEAPVLARLAARRTKALRLDVRACRVGYEAELIPADLDSLEPHGRELIEALGIRLPATKRGALP